MRSWSVDETPEERASRREHVGRLKFLLQKNPGDTTTRRRLVEAYRAGGHPEQAARFAIGLGEPLDRAEEQAYVAMLRGIRADEATARRLSLLPPGMELPPQIPVGLAAKRLPDEWRGWVFLVAAAWICAVALWMVTMGVSYGFTVFGSPDARAVALGWSVASSALTCAASVLSTAGCLASREIGPTVVWGVITLITALGVVAFVIRFLG